MKHPIVPFPLRPLLLLALLSLTSCRTPLFSSQPAVPETPPAPTMYEWNGDDVEGPLKVKISLSAQKADLFKGTQNVGWTYVATGLPGHPTPTGSLQVMEKKADKLSGKYGVICNAAEEVVDWDAAVGRESIPAGCHFVHAPMPNWMRLTGYGIGMHAGVIPNPGSPASHGCIRLPEYISVKLFENAVEGTPVTITP